MFPKAVVSELTSTLSTSRRIRTVTSLPACRSSEHLLLILVNKANRGCPACTSGAQE
jgi:hypothetical protein